MDEGQAVVVEALGTDGWPDPLAVDEDRASGVGLVHAADELDEGRLAGPVLAHESVDLTGHQGEVGVVEDGHSPEGLGEGLDRQAWGAASVRSRVAGDVSLTAAHGGSPNGWAGICGVCD